MATTEQQLDREHKTMMLIELMHACVVMSVVVAATVVYLTHVMGLPSDLLGFVYGGAISYAGGRAAASRGALTRKTDTNGNGRT